MLLEVLLSLAMFALAAAVVGSATRSAMRTAVDMRVRAEAANMVQTAFARLATEEIEFAGVSATPFDEEDPTWTYEIAIENVDSEASMLKRVEITVSNGEGAESPCTLTLTQWMLEPPVDAEYEDPGI